MRRAATKLLAVQLMIVNPDRFRDEFARAGADLIIGHQEAVASSLIKAAQGK